MYQSTSNFHRILFVFCFTWVLFSHISFLLLFSFHFSLFRLDQPTRHVLLQRFNLRLRSMWTFQRGTLPRCRTCLKVRPLLFVAFFVMSFVFLTPVFNSLFSSYHSIFQQWLHTNIVWWSMGSFDKLLEFVF